MNPLYACTKGILSDHSTSLIFSKNTSARWNRFYTRLCLALFLLCLLNIIPASTQANDNFADRMPSDLQEVNSRRAIEPPNLTVGDIAKIFNCDAATTIPKSECLALVELYQQTDGANWTEDWDNTLEPCKWSGVTCQNGHVSILKLEGLGLIGALPASIGELTQLTTLKLSQNGLTNIPPEIGKLSNLFWLGLQDNQLSRIPPEIGALSQLTTLHLGGNQFENIPSEIGNLTKLQRLNLKQNFLANLPEEISQLVDLIGVDISYNQLTALPEGFENLQEIVSLDLNGNEWLDFPIVLTKLDNLKYLYINSGNLRALPSEIANMKSLNHIDASNNELESIPTTFGQLPKLETFDFSNNLLTTIPAEIERLPKLESLSLAFNRIEEPLERYPWLERDWVVDQILPPDFRLVSQADSQTFDGGTPTVTYSMGVIWSLLPIKKSDGYYEIRYATSLDDLDPTSDAYQSAVTASRAESNYVVDDMQAGATYFFQLYTHLPESTDQDDIIVRKARVSEPSQIISATIPLLREIEKQKEEGTEPEGDSIYIKIKGESLPADTSATLFMNDVIFNESPSVDSDGKLNLELDFSDIPSFLARYNTEIVLNHPNSSNRTYLSVKFDFLSESIKDVSLATADITPANNSIKVPPYVSSFLFIPHVAR